MTEDVLTIALEALQGIVTDCWQFGRTVERMLARLESADGTRIASQFQWLRENLARHAQDAGLTIVDPTGQDYSEGMAVNVVNLTDFAPDEVLRISRTIEPIIMREGRVMKPGTVMVERTGE